MKKIPFLNDYYITEDGEIFSSKRGRLKKLKSKIDTSRYLRIGLRDNNGKERKYLVHRLVALTYIPNPCNLDYVNHIDGDKLNNSVSNLEWCSFQENMSHAYRTGLKTNLGMNNGRTILNEDIVKDIYLDLVEGKRVCDIAEKYGVSRSCISKIKKKDNWGYLLKDMPEIPHKSKKQKLSDKTVRWICEMLESGYKTKQIMKMSTTVLSEDQVNDIRRGKCYKSIVSDYNI